MYASNLLINMKMDQVNSYAQTKTKIKHKGKTRSVPQDDPMYKEILFPTETPVYTQKNFLSTYRQTKKTNFKSTVSEPFYTTPRPLPPIMYQVPKIRAPDIKKIQEKLKRKVLSMSRQQHETSDLDKSADEPRASIKDIISNLTKQESKVMITQTSISSSEERDNFGEYLDELEEIEIVNNRRQTIHERAQSQILHFTAPVDKFVHNVDKIKRDINAIRHSQFKHKYDFLNALHRSVQKKVIEGDQEYEKAKNVYSQYKQKKILANKDHAVSSKLYLLNKNPYFEINNLITFPHIIADKSLLANIYQVNMYRLQTKNKK